VFVETFLRVKLLVEDQPTYRMHVDVFGAFATEFLSSDRVVVGLEDLIEWRDE
jgi:hypothetical protein